MKIKLKEIQKRRNIKNVELAKMIGVSNQQITNYHSGEKTPPLSTLEKIAKALSCEIAELLPLGERFMHIYNEKGEWQGIIKKPVYIPSEAEKQSILKGLEQDKLGLHIAEDEVEQEMNDLCS